MASCIAGSGHELLSVHHISRPGRPPVRFSWGLLKVVGECDIQKAQPGPLLHISKLSFQLQSLYLGILFLISEEPVDGCQ